MGEVDRQSPPAGRCRIAQPCQLKVLDQDDVDARGAAGDHWGERCPQGLCPAHEPRITAQQMDRPVDAPFAAGRRMGHLVGAHEGRRHVPIPYLAGRHQVDVEPLGDTIQQERLSQLVTTALVVGYRRTDPQHTRSSGHPHLPRVAGSPRVCSASAPTHESAVSRSLAVLDLRSESTPVRVLLRDLWDHRDLLPLLARQHFRGQYRAARLGIAWSAAQPLLRGLVLAVIFSRVARFETTVPYPAFVFAGTATFQYISSAVTAGTTGIASSGDLAGRVYFPRLLLAGMPAAAQVPSYLVTLAVVIALSLGFGVAPGWQILTLPATVSLAFVLVASASAILGLAHVYARDVGPMVTAIVSIGFYITPVIYPATELGGWRWLLELNPATGAIAAVRWSLFAGDEPGVGRPVLITLLWTAILLALALVLYRRHERICVDRL